MTTDAPILPSTPEGLRAALDDAGILYPDWDDARLRKAIADDPSILDPEAPVKVAVPDAAEVDAAYAGFVQRVAQGVVNALWEAGWRAPVATTVPVPEPVEPAYKATLSGTELTIVKMPKRITHRQIIRDAQDRISGVLDIEEDAE